MFFSKKNRVFRKIGFYSDQNGIVNRYKREKYNWNIHLSNSKKFILRSLQTKKKETALILGSGWLLDVPIDELSKNFSKVVLFDVRHPKKILEQLKNFPNVVTQEIDLTGYSEILLKISNKTDILNLQPDNKHLDLIKSYNADFIVSLNLLNQLDIFLIDFLRSRFCFSEEILKLFSKKIQTEHFNLLTVNKSCLITDYIQENYEKEQKINEKQLVFSDFPKAKFEENWDWIFETNGKYNEFSKNIFKVKAIDF